MTFVSAHMPDLVWPPEPGTPLDEDRPIGVLVLGDGFVRCKEPGCSWEGEHALVDFHASDHGLCGWTEVVEVA